VKGFTLKRAAARHVVALVVLGFVSATCGCGSKQSDGGSTGSAAPSTLGRTPKLFHIEASPEEVRGVQNDVKKRNDAFYSGDFKTLLEMTYDGLIERSGGADKAAEAMRTSLDQSTARGMKIESFDFPEQPAFLKTTVREYVLVPTRKIMSVGAERAELVSFEFGVRSIGAPTWTYVDGPQITPATVNTLFPDFPADCPLPTISRKKL
jgi:hypothetical protein